MTFSQKQGCPLPRSMPFEKGRQRGEGGEENMAKVCVWGGGGGGRERRQDKIILLSGLRPITTGMNIQAVRIVMDPKTDLNSVF